jgi:hypothetical protein
MKTITVSFLLVAALAAVLFLSVWYVTDNIDAAKGAAAFAVTALPSVSSWFEQSEAKKSSVPGEKMAIRAFEGFTISFPVVVALGTIIALAILNIGMFFTGGLVGMMGSSASGQALSVSEKAELIGIAGLGNVPILSIGSYLLGKWISWRCARHGILAVLLVALLTALISKTIDFAALTADEWRTLYQQERTVVSAIVVWLMQFAFISVASLLGYWRGRRQRTTKYMNYLLRALPDETQNSLVDLAFDEVKRIVDAKRSSQPLARGALTPVSTSA